MGQNLNHLQNMNALANAAPQQSMYDLPSILGIDRNLYGCMGAEELQNIIL